MLIQGAGRVNADQATSVAGGDGGVYVEPSLLAAGEYMGTHYESFANVVYPGETWTTTFTVHNPAAAGATVEVGDEMLVQMDVTTTSVGRIALPGHGGSHLSVRLLLGRSLLRRCGYRA